MSNDELRTDLDHYHWELPVKLCIDGQTQAIGSIYEDDGVIYIQNEET
jgi:hypothetical protein